MEDQARTLCMVGTLDEAIDLCHEALDVFRSIPAPFGIADALTDLGLCYMRRGELERATEALEEAGRMMVESGATGYNATQVRCYLADNALLILERSGSAERRLAETNAAAACRAAVSNSKAVPLGVPLAARCRGTLDWLRGHRRSARRWWQRSLDAGERIGIPYQVALTELDLGRLTGERARIERSAGIFTDLGAELDAAQAAEALSATSFSASN